MGRLGRGLLAVMASLGLASFAGPATAIPEPAAAAIIPLPVLDPTPLPPPPPTVRDMLSKGVVIVVSKATQSMHVYRDGALWRETRVSTGKSGHATPAGVFAILQKRVKHRSNIYSNAPMPFMQRLTWSGIALHAGYVPNYPASHGCIRMPREFAAALYKITRFDETAVIVTDHPIPHAEAGLRLASLVDSPVPLDGQKNPVEPVRLAAAAMGTSEPSPRSVAPILLGGGRAQTIQLVAATSAGEASAHWERVVRAVPQLARADRSIQAATVNARRYYRLRATAPGAHALCGTLKRSGFDCFAVS